MSQPFQFHSTNFYYLNLLKMTRERGDLWEIGCCVSGLGTSLKEAIESKQVSFDEAHKLKDLLNEFLLLEEVELDKLKRAVENLVNDGSGDKTANL